MTSKTVFDEVADFAFLPADKIPQDVLSAAALLLVDTIGVAAGAAHLQAGTIAREMALELFQSDKESQVPMMFDGRLVSKAGAAFAGATQIDNLDAHDGYNPTKGHIGCAVVPALFAFAHRVPELTGRDSLAAFVIAYEIATRAAIALHSTVSDYHTSGAWNALGVGAMGCRLNGSSAMQLRHALGIAEFHGPRSQMMREIATPTMLHDGSGMGALVGVMASQMAMRGFEGAPAITVEACGVADIWADLGTNWTVPLNYIKPYPICRWAHAAIDAVQILQAEENFDAKDIRQIKVKTFGEAARLFPGMPDTTSKAQYSLAFAVAKMVQFGRIGVEHITGDALADNQTADILSRIVIEEDARHNRRFPESRWSDLTIELTNGRVLKSGDVHARGGPESPMDLSEIEQKFHGLCRASISAARASAIWETGLKLTEPNALFRELLAEVTPMVDRPVVPG
ncbi:MAG: MmgE/PrpD family protein [Rhizobiaceae bacterium]|nr:MmgE/PrpD family protein [Rhizobiaceae bacterium]